MSLSAHYRYLFGGDKPWHATAWVAVDDRVRGGKSQSYLEASTEPGSPSVRFRGNLDITALEGAGFASQRTPDAEQWDLSGFEGLHLSIGDGDGKKYTLVLKDEIPPRGPDGREQSSVGWEYDFVGDEAELHVRWTDLSPTYRGSPKPDARPLNPAGIKRISIMMRSFFGEQQGTFALHLKYIAAAEFTNRA